MKFLKETIKEIRREVSMDVNNFTKSKTQSLNNEIDIIYNNKDMS